MLLRLIAGAALLTFGYYLGKQVGRMEHIREELRQIRESRAKETESSRKSNGANGAPGV